MNKWGLVTMAALVAALAAAPARSQEAPGGFYIGASGGAVYTDAAGSLEVITGGFHDRKVPNGGKVYIGHKRGNVGMEAGYYYLGTYDFLVTPAGAVQDQLKTHAIVVAGVYEAEMFPGYTLVARLGVAFTQAQYDCKLFCGGAFLDTDETGTSGMWGVGMDMRMTQILSLRLEFEHFGGVHHAVVSRRFKDGYDMFSAGVRLGF